MRHRSLFLALLLTTPSLACSGPEVEGGETSDTSGDTGTASSESVGDSDSESGDTSEAASGDGDGDADAGDGDTDTGDGDTDTGDGDTDTGDGDTDTGDGDGDTGGTGGPGDDCDLFAQDCGAGLSCYPTELGGECMSTGTAGSSTMNLEQCLENNDCIEGLFCNPENFNHCVPFCEIGTDCANGEPCNSPSQPDTDSLPDGVGYCYPWP